MRLTWYKIIPLTVNIKSGSGTNTLTFRGRLNTTANGFLSFTDNFIHVNGTATMQADSETFSGILSETAAANGTDNSIVLDASSGASATVAGAITDTATLVVDGVSGTIAVGQVVTVNGAGGTPAASITSPNTGTDAGSDTNGSTDNSITVSAVCFWNNSNIIRTKLQLRMILTYYSLLMLVKVLNKTQSQC